MFIAGRIIQGLCTSLLLIAAVPPLALGYPIGKLKTTAMIMNMCIFGAVAARPGDRRPAGPGRRLAAALLDHRRDRRSRPGARRPHLRGRAARRPDLAASTRSALGLAAVGCVAAFFGSSQLTSHAFLDPIAIVPLIGGLAVIVILIVYQATAKNPLLTIREMLTSTIPVAGIVLALLAAAASVSATALTAAAMAGPVRPAAPRPALPAGARRRRASPRSSSAT